MVFLICEKEVWNRITVKMGRNHVLRIEAPGRKRLGCLISEAARSVVHQNAVGGKFCGQYKVHSSVIVDIGNANIFGSIRLY